jgi:S-adenosylmethionine hydrolase
MKIIPIITLTTDFSLEDHFVGALKGVILSICPQARIVDLTHNLNSGDIRAGAFIIDASHRYFPPDTIHIAVVDPGVGSSRLPLALKTEYGTFLAPDNGILTYVLERYPESQARAITNPGVVLDEISHTFHGRDVFAPAAVHLANGFDFKQLGPMVEFPIRFNYRKFQVSNKQISGEVRYIDKFGNVITNIPNKTEILKSTARLMIKSRIYELILADNYASLPANKAGIIPGSAGFYEIALNCASAENLMGLSLGDELILDFS